MGKLRRLCPQELTANCHNCGKPMTYDLIAEYDFIKPRNPHIRKISMLFKEDMVGVIIERRYTTDLPLPCDEKSTYPHPTVRLCCACTKPIEELPVHLFYFQQVKSCYWLKGGNYGAYCTHKRKEIHRRHITKTFADDKGTSHWDCGWRDRCLCYAPVSYVQHSFEVNVGFDITDSELRERAIAKCNST